MLRNPPPEDTAIRPEALGEVRGVTLARALPGAEAAALLEPWLGKDSLPADLPVPRLVAVDLDHANPATAEALMNALQRAQFDVTVDDHSLWIADVQRSASMARWAATGIAALVALAAAAITILATRAALTARREAVEVLYLSGAQPGMIASLFQWRFAGMGATAGLFGGGAAAMIALFARLAGGSDGITPVLPLAWSDALAALAAPLAAGVIAALAARLAAFRMFGSMGGAQDGPAEAR